MMKGRRDCCAWVNEQPAARDTPHAGCIAHIIDCGRYLLYTAYLMSVHKYIPTALRYKVGLGTSWSVHRAVGGPRRSM